MAAAASWRRTRRWAGGLTAAVAVLLVLFLYAAGYFGGDARQRFAASGAASPVAALYVSGDAGLRFGMGPVTARALAAHGVPVLGFNAPTLFRFHRTRAETEAIVADMLRQALRETGRDRLVLIGQSFGADVLQTGLAALPPALRRHVAGIVLVVPGNAVYFRADVSGLAYRGPPDSDGRATLRALDWSPLTCIHGLAEPDSACAGLRLGNATVIGMPGGHFLARDADGLVAHVLTAVKQAAGQPVGERMR